MADYNLGTASGKIEINGSGASKGFKVAETSARAFMGVVTGKVSDIESFGKKLTGVGAAGVAGFGLAVKTAADFEKQMSGVRAVTGGTQKDFDDLRAKALQLGADTAFSASEAASAIEELAKAGIPVKDILNGAAEGAVALAAAGGVGLEEAATIAANAMNQFGLGADKVGEVADILAGVANTSASDVSGIGQALSQAGAVANLAGLSFRDTAIAIGELADAGITGSDAGTSLKTMLNNLIPSTTAQSAEFKRLGLQTYNLADANKTLAKEGLGQAKNIDQVKESLGKYLDELGEGTYGTMKNANAVDKLLVRQGGLNNQFFKANGEVKSLRGVQEALNKSTKDMTQEQKLASLEILFGADAMRASAILSKQGAKGYDEFAAAVGKTSAADVAKTRLDNLSGAVEQFKGSFETAQITIGSIFLPIITRVVQALTSVINAFNNLNPNIQKAIGIVAAFAAGMAILVGLVLASLTSIALFVAQFFAMRIIRIAAGYLLTFSKEMRAGTSATAAFTAANRAAAVQIRRTTLLAKIMGKTMLIAGKAALLAGRLIRFAFSPIGLAILAVVIILVLLYKKFKPFRDLVNSVAKAIKGALISAFNFLKQAVMDILPVLKQIGRQIMAAVMPALRALGSLLKGQLFAAFKVIAAAVKADLLPALRDLAATFKAQALPAIKQILAAIKPLVPVFLRIAGIVIGVLFAAFKTYAKFLLGTVYPILIKIAAFVGGQAIQAFLRFALGIIQALTGVVKIVTGFINIIKGIFSGDLGQVVDGAGQVFGGLKDLLSGLFKAAFSVIIQVVKTAGTAILGALKGLFNSADGATGGFLSKFIGVFVTAFNAVKSAVTTVFNVVKTVITTSLAVIGAIWSKFWGVFGGPITAVFNLIIAIVKLGWATLKLIFYVALVAILLIVKNAWAVITTTIQIAWGIIKAVVSAGIAVVKAVFSAGWNALKSVVSAVWGYIKAVVSTGIAVVKAVVSAGLNAVRAIFARIVNGWKNIITGAWNAINGATGGALGRLAGQVSAGLGKVLSTVKNIFNRIKTAVSTAISGVVSLVAGLGGRVLGAIGDFGSLLFSKGAELIQGLVNGITSKISAITDAMSKVTDKVKGFLPGSPIKEGPLVSWNNGGAGKRLMSTLAEGLRDTSEIDKSMRAVSTYINGAQLMVQPALNTAAIAGMAPLGVPVATAAKAGLPSAKAMAKNGRKGGDVQLAGVLSLADGEAYISGLAEDVYDRNGGDNRRRDRMQG